MSNMVINFSLENPRERRSELLVITSTSTYTDRKLFKRVKDGEEVPMTIECSADEHVHVSVYEKDIGIAQFTHAMLMLVIGLGSAGIVPAKYRAAVACIRPLAKFIMGKVAGDDNITSVEDRSGWLATWNFAVEDMPINELCKVEATRSHGREKDVLTMTALRL